jgi:hypothetical protein
MVVTIQIYFFGGCSCTQNNWASPLDIVIVLTFLGSMFATPMFSGNVLIQASDSLLEYRTDAGHGAM